MNYKTSIDNTIIGKTIKSIEVQNLSKTPINDEYYDDEVCIFTMTDGTKYQIRGVMNESYSGDSEREYPTFVDVNKI